MKIYESVKITPTRIHTRVKITENGDTLIIYDGCTPEAEILVRRGQAFSIDVRAENNIMMPLVYSIELDPVPRAE